MLEVQKTVQAVNISGDFQRALPLSSRREWSDSLALTPGIMSRSTDQFGGEVYFLRGTENENHVVQIDGGDVGSFEQNWPGFFARLNTEAISDTQVKTAGVDAASPLAVGMVINIATPSGTNQLRGSAAAVYTAKAWNGDNNPGGTPVAARVFQPDVAVGGPVVKDRAWFFASMRYTDRSTGVSRDATLLGNLNALVPNFQPFDNQGHLKYYFVKGTTQLSPNHQMYGYVQRDGNAEEASFQVDGANFEVSAPGGSAYTGRLTSVWGSRMTTRLLAGYNTKGVNPSFSVFDNHLGTGGPSRPVHPTAFISGGVVQGSGRIAVLDNIPSRNITPASKLTFSADMTYFHTGGRAGSHEIQIGTYLQPRLEARNTIYYSGGGFALEEVVLRDPANPAAGTIPFHRRYYSAPTEDSQRLLAHDNAVFVQDSWKPAPRLTINGGLRLDWVKNTNRIYDLVTLDDFIVGPRVGGTYVLDADQKDIVHASWGRVGDVPNSAYLDPTSPGGTTGGGTSKLAFRDEYSTSIDGVFDRVLQTPAAPRTNPNLRTDPNRRWPFVDELIAGYRRQLPGQVSVDVSFLRRDYKSRPALVEVNGIYDNDVFRGYRDESLNDIFLLTDNQWNWFIYQGLELTAAKRTTKAQLITTYTRAWQQSQLAYTATPLAARRRHVAAERSRVVHSAGRVPERQRIGDDPRRRHEQPLRNGRHTKSDVGKAPVPYRAVLLGAVGHSTGHQLLSAVGTVFRPDRHPAERGRSAVRPSNGHALERPGGVESAGDRDPVRECGPGHRSDQSPESEDPQPAARTQLRAREAALRGRVRHVQSAECRQRSAIPERRKSAFQRELHREARRVVPRRQPSAAALGPADGQIRVLSTSR